ncbi:MAG: deaminase [Kiloniellales bacterium]|nr:deaminase [Kiloniellales bacterium]
MSGLETTPPRCLDHWDRRFLAMAELVAGWSKDPSTKVGCVITSPDRRVVSTGFNGLPAGVEDSLERLQDRNVKYDMTVHAERNAIISARRDLTGYRLYATLMPCSVCAAMIIQAGLAEVIAPACHDPRIAETFRLDLTAEMFAEAGVSLFQAEPAA